MERKTHFSINTSIKFKQLLEQNCSRHNQEWLDQQSRTLGSAMIRRKGKLHVHRVYTTAMQTALHGQRSVFTLCLNMVDYRCNNFCLEVCSTDTDCCRCFYIIVQICLCMDMAASLRLAAVTVEIWIFFKLPTQAAVSKHIILIHVKTFEHWNFDFVILSDFTSNHRVLRYVLMMAAAWSKTSLCKVQSCLRKSYRKLSARSYAYLLFLKIYTWSGVPSRISRSAQIMFVLLF